MNDTILLKLLLIIKGNGNITSLKKDGYNFSQILEFVNFSINSKFATFNDGVGLKITPFGENKIQDLNKKYSNYNSQQWIVPEDKSRVPILEEKDVFLPDQDDLLFLNI